MHPILEALLLSAGYNSALVAIGAGLLGAAAGAVGTFLFLRKRSLVSDAISHATLPGIGLAFILMVALGGDGRNLLGLMAGSAVTAWLGLTLVEWASRRTRLAEDAAIGAVLSVFFGFGIVLLTVIQGMSAGKQAGLQGYLLGSTAGMLLQDAVVIAVGGLLAAAVVVLLRRPMTLVSFDPEFAAAAGYDVRRIDLAMLGLVMAVTVVGLKLVGLVLIVALLIIPPVTARFWTNRSDVAVLLSAAFGAVSGYVGSSISASAPDLPTGPIIVLSCFALFAVSLLFAPDRGVVASLVRHRRFQLKVHRRQGLLALAHGEPIYDRLTLSVLKRGGYLRPDGVPTDLGRDQAAHAYWDERRWEVARRIHQAEALAGRYDGLTPMEAVFTADEIAAIDRQLGPVSPAGRT
ncbi:metal ABC transporter permease [Chthonobacter albigriseus]|uniref:metal ABC transporter permease n=1 Tax=Chthonobacter albigriseus TaxID=1683161 RepID=UPI0015EE8C34|nr:metal ABC transporter permease [Chthonobacter albigriseus]